MKLLIYFVLPLLFLVGCINKMIPLDTVNFGREIDSVSPVDETGAFAIVSGGKIEFLTTRAGLRLSKEVYLGNLSINNIFCSIESCWVGGGTHQKGMLAKIEISKGSIERIGNDSQYSEIYFITSSLKQGYILTGHSDGEIIVWDAKQGKEILNFGEYSSEVFALAVSQDGRRLYSGKSVDGIDLWDIETGKLITSNKEIEGSIFTLTMDESAKSIICGGSRGILYIIDNSELSITKKIAVTDEAILSSDVRKRDAEIVCGLSSGYVGVVHINGSGLKVYKLHDDAVMYVKFIDEGDRILSVSKDGTVKIWDATTTIQ